MNFFGSFVASRTSGWIAIILSVLFSASVWYIKDLQKDAAFCKGQLAAATSKRALENRVIDTIRRDTKDVVKDVERIRDEAEDVVKEKPEPAPDEIVPPSGCAAERGPDAVLRYHGWLRDE